MPDARRAPVQAERDNGKPAGTVPWETHEKAAKAYNALGHRQTAEKLAERSGFSYSELACLLAGDDPFAYDGRAWPHDHPPVPGWEPRK